MAGLFRIHSTPLYHSFTTQEASRKNKWCTRRGADDDDDDDNDDDDDGDDDDDDDDNDDIKTPDTLVD